MFRRWRQWHALHRAVAYVLVFGAIWLIKKHLWAVDEATRPSSGTKSPSGPKVYLNTLGKEGVYIRSTKTRDCLKQKEVLHKTAPYTAFRLDQLDLPGGAEDAHADGETPDERAHVFREIFQRRVWNVAVNSDAGYGEVQSSGLGSTLANTRQTVAVLGAVLRLVAGKLEKRRLSVLDLPCGDMVWMSGFLANHSHLVERYDGRDIVPSLVAAHRRRYAHHRNWTFAVHDIVRQPLPRAYDVIIARQLTQHLTDVETLRALRHFSASGSRFVLLTDYSNVQLNTDILEPSRLDRFRRQNLQLAPFSLAPPFCSSRDGRIGGWLSLWKLPLVIVDGCGSTISVKKTRHMGSVFFHCV